MKKDFFICYVLLELGNPQGLVKRQNFPTLFFFTIYLKNELGYLELDGNFDGKYLVILDNCFNSYKMLLFQKWIIMITFDFISHDICILYYKNNIHF